MFEPVEFARLYRGKLVVVKADGTRLDMELAKLSRLALVPDDAGILRYKNIVAERAVLKGRKLWVEEFANQPKEVTLEIHFFKRDSEPAGVVDVDPVSIVSSSSGRIDPVEAINEHVIPKLKFAASQILNPDIADVVHAGADCIDALEYGLVWEEIVFAPRTVKMREA